MSKRAGFATRIGAIAASVGSAVGLGNIWRFPYQAGENGGGAFILVYVVFVLILGIPVMLSEFIIGRSTHKSMMGALRELLPGSGAHWLSLVCITGSVITLSFYSVVCGWVCEYLYQAFTGQLTGHTVDEYGVIFTTFVSSPWRCVGWTLLFLVVNFAVMLRGVRRGIERLSQVLMPLLFLLLLVFMVNSLMMPGRAEGLRFVFSPDFSKLTFDGILDALGQAFMSLSLGVACLVTYASYFQDDCSLLKDAGMVATLDTLVAILSGVIIFPAVFTYGLTPEAGPKLVFEVLPSIFQQMTGGTVWCVLFFLLLLFASLTSTVSLSEISISFAIEEHNMSRRRATLWCAAIVGAIATVCALSFNVLSDVKLLNRNIFDLLNDASANVFMLLGGLFTAVVVGWLINRQVVRQQLDDGSALSRRLTHGVVWCLRYVAPAAIVLIFLHYTGLL
ncbi:MAG: sodium-dependent transporter [Muribaculaceae bacterium]|nr:sodium-dependent transporter [Muribaculaceae bacterium]